MLTQINYEYILIHVNETTAPRKGHDMNLLTTPQLEALIDARHEFCTTACDCEAIERMHFDVEQMLISDMPLDDRTHNMLVHLNDLHNLYTSDDALSTV